MTLKEQLYKVTAQIPKGKVATYGQLAALAGIKSPRVVGNFLHQNTDPVAVPCHRVVNREGRVAKNFGMGGSDIQIERLQAEGVEIIEGKVDLEKFRWEVMA